MQQRLAALEAAGMADYKDIFEGFNGPRARRKRGAPLDQRVTITVTGPEKFSLTGEVENLRNSGERVSMSQFIRNRALGSVDINGWANIARTALLELAELEAKEDELRAEHGRLLLATEELEDKDEVALAWVQLGKINDRLARLTAQNEQRVVRLTGRMSFKEAELVKWRAERLCISASDYLRMMIFSMEPNSKADAHLSLDAKRRFYVSIIEVANNGWGTSPHSYECSQCSNYVEEIERLHTYIREQEL